MASGASRKNEKWEHVEGETVAVEGKSEAEKLATDPMYRLEHGAEDKKKAEDAAPQLSKLLVCVVCVLESGVMSVLGSGVMSLLGLCLNMLYNIRICSNSIWMILH